MILYPKLEDNAYVLKYPAVQGMQKDVFFFNHLHKENGTEDSVSKSNIFEVRASFVDDQWPLLSSSRWK